MPGPTPPAVPLSEEERPALHTLIRAHKTPQHLSFRAHVLLRLGCQSIALACEPPEASGRPISHGTPRALAEEAGKRGIVGTLSKRHVGRFVKSCRPPAAQASLLAQCGT
jgi:putative transposase